MLSSFSQVVVMTGLSFLGADRAEQAAAAPVGAVYYVRDHPHGEWPMRRLNIVDADGKVTRRGGRGDLSDNLFNQLGYDWARERILAVTDGAQGTEFLSIDPQDGVAELAFVNEGPYQWLYGSGVVGGRDGLIYYWAVHRADDANDTLLAQIFVRRKPYDEPNDGSAIMPGPPVTQLCQNPTWVENFQGRMTGVLSWCGGKPYFFDATLQTLMPIDLPTPPSVTTSRDGVVLITDFTWHDSTTDTLFTMMEGDRFDIINIIGLAPRSKGWQKSTEFRPNSRTGQYDYPKLAVFIPGPVNRCPCE